VGIDRAKLEQSLTGCEVEKRVGDQRNGDKANNGAHSLL
jgi:hypothetical protein